MTENDYNVPELIEDYVSHLYKDFGAEKNLRVEDIRQQFQNFSVFQLKLYTLRQQLYTFIETTFTRFIEEHGLCGKPTRRIRKKISDLVRTTYNTSSKSPENSSSSCLENRFSTSTGSCCSIAQENLFSTSPIQCISGKSF